MNRLILALSLIVSGVQGQSNNQNEYLPFIETLHKIEREYKSELSYIQILYIFSNDVNNNFLLGLEIEKRNDQELIIKGLKKRFNFLDGSLDNKTVSNYCSVLKELIDKKLIELNLTFDYVEFISDYLLSSVDNDAWLMSQLEYDKYLENGTLIGISYKRDSSGTYLINSVEKNSAAYLANLKIDDRVVDIRNIPTKYLGGGFFLKNISGQIGDSVSISVNRAGKTLKKSLVISDYHQSMPDDTIIFVSTNTLNIKLNHLNSGIANKIKSQLETNSSIEKVIIDLQNCTGGSFKEAVEIANLFIEKDVEITTVSYRKRSYNNVYKSTNLNPFKDCRVVILTNHQTTSGAEIIASAIQSSKRGIVVGTNTGKVGNVQIYFNLQASNTYRGKITIGEILDPEGISINEKGVLPDIELDEEEDILNYAIDKLD